MELTDAQKAQAYFYRIVDTHEAGNNVHGRELPAKEVVVLLNAQAETVRKEAAPATREEITNAKH